MDFDRTVKRLPKDPGETGWNKLLPPAPSARTLQEDIHADWLIIGAGFAGLASARELSRLCPGDKIVLLDAVRVGEGPAGRNSGFMIDLPHDISASSYAGAEEKDRKQTAMNRLAISFARDAAQEYGLSKEAFNLSGKINAAATESGMRHNAQYARHLSSMGEEYRFLNAGEMKDMTGTEYYQGGLYTPGTAMIQPAMFVRAMATGLADKVMIFENSPVTNLKHSGGEWTARTPTGSVRAPKVILAVNGHVENFGFYKRQLMHVFTYASMTSALTTTEVKRLGGIPQWSATPADPMGTTVRRISGTGGDRIIVRNRFTYNPGMEVSGERLEAIKRSHVKSFKARFTQIKDTQMEYTWGGRLCLAWNSVSAFGEIESGLFSACCQNGVGAAKGTHAGIMAARLATRTTDPDLDDLIGQVKPKHLPPEPFAWIGVNTTLRWKEWQAGREL